ncbi:alpha/beta fold hydrolase [Roseobacteraceae bacterium S113]
MTWTTRPRSKAPCGLAVWRTGSGPALILIHGVGLRAEAWAAMLPALSTRFEVHAIDMPGHGGSPQTGCVDMSDYVSKIMEYMSHLKYHVNIAGHSMGAILALELAAALPKQVTSVAALNGIYRRSDVARDAVRARAAALPREGTSDPTKTLERWFGAAPEGALREARDACGNWLRGVDPVGYKSAYTAFAESDGPSDALLDALRCPALFLTGAQDPNSTSEMSRAMAARVSHGRAVILEDAAHMAPMTHPDAVAQALVHTSLSDRRS